MTTIAELRQADTRKWSQQQLATYAGVSTAVVSRMENGHPVQRSSFRLVCIALGLPQDTDPASLGVTIR